MNREDIINMAREAGADTLMYWDIEKLKRFEALVRADERDKWMERAHTMILGEREACAKVVGEFAQKWWSIHCASNKHMETTRKAHNDFCALQAAIRARGQHELP
jgi:hypothetical protein